MIQLPGIVKVGIPENFVACGGQPAQVSDPMIGVGFDAGAAQQGGRRIDGHAHVVGFATRRMIREHFIPSAFCLSRQAAVLRLVNLCASLCFASLCSRYGPTVAHLDSLESVKTPPILSTGASDH